MSRNKRYLGIVFLCLFTQLVNSGSVIFVNLCQDEDIMVVKVDKNGEEIKNKRYAFSSFKMRKIQKNDLRLEDQEKTILGHGAMIFGVDFKYGEDVWVKGNSWRRFKGTKAHYKDFGLAKKDANYIVFITESKKGFSWGGTFKYLIEEFKGDKKAILETIKKLYLDVVPDMQENYTSNFKGLKSSLELEKHIVKLQEYKRIINSLGEMKKYFSVLFNRIDLYYKNFVECLLDKKNRKKRIKRIASKSLGFKEIRNIAQRKKEAKNRDESSEKKFSKSFGSIVAEYVQEMELSQEEIRDVKLFKQKELIVKRIEQEEFLEKKYQSQELSEKIRLEKKNKEYAELRKNVKFEQLNRALEEKEKREIIKKEIIEKKIVKKEDYCDSFDDGIEELKPFVIKKKRRGKKKTKFLSKEKIDLLIKRGDKQGFNGLIDRYVAGKSERFNLNDYMQHYDIAVLYKFIKVIRSRIDLEKDKSPIGLVKMLSAFEFRVARKKAELKYKN